MCCRQQTLTGSDFQRVLWAVWHIPHTHQGAEVIKIMLRASKSMMSTRGVELLRRFSNKYMADLDAYKRPSAAIMLTKQDLVGWL